MVEGAPKVRSAGGSITAAAVPPLLHERLAPLLDGPEHVPGVVVTAVPVSTELEDVVVELPVTVGLTPPGPVADVVNDAGRLEIGDIRNESSNVKRVTSSKIVNILVDKKVKVKSKASLLE